MRQNASSTMIRLSSEKSLKSASNTGSNSFTEVSVSDCGAWIGLQ